MNRILCLLFTAMLCGAAEPTSKTNANLQKFLKHSPAADANKDGILKLGWRKDGQRVETSHITHRGGQVRDSNYTCVESTHNDMPVYSKNNCNKTALIADI